MSSVAAPAHWTRWAALVAVVLGVLCGPAAFTATATASATGSAGTTATGSTSPTADASARAGAPTVDSPAPGCRPHAPSDGAGQPATPARHGTAYELLPALFDGRGALGGWGLDQVVACPAGRAPPPAGPPTPVDLSVLLRV